MSVPRDIHQPVGTDAHVLTTGHALTTARAHPQRGQALLVPGFTGSKEDFWPVLPLLRDLGWTAHALDQRGQLDSPPRPDGRYGLADLADDLRSVVAVIDDGTPLHIVGHSLGGLVAAEAVRRGLRPASLTLLCSGPGALPRERHGALPALVAVLPEMPLTEVWAAKEALDRDAGVEPPPPDVQEFLHRRFLAADPHALKGMAQILLTQPDDVDALAETGVVIHVAHGADDDAWPIETQNAMARRLGRVADVIPGSAHSPAVEAPSATVALLNRLWSASG